MRRLCPIQHPVLSFSIATGLALAPAGCVAPAAKDRVAEVQLDAVMRLSESYAQDLAALRAAVSAIARIDAESRRSKIEQAILSVYITPTGGADLAALNAALEAPAQAAPTDALTAEARAGRLTPDDARAWLTDYALAWKMRDGADARRRLLGRLSPVRELDAAHADLLASLDAHTNTVARIFADAAASAEALTRARALEREFFHPGADTLARLWRQRVLARVSNPDSRRLLETLLGDYAPSLLPPTTTEPDHAD